MNSLPKISLLLKNANVSCKLFWKSKISSESQKVSIAEDNNPFKELEKMIENLRSIQPDLVSENMDAASFTGMMQKFQLYSSHLLALGLLGNCWEDVCNDNNDAIETEGEPVYCLNRNQLSKITEATQSILVFKDGAIVQSYANHGAHIIDHHLKKEKSRQITIRACKKCF